MKTYEPNFGAFHIRKWFSQVEEIWAGETGSPADGQPLVKYMVGACIKNPYAGQFVEDLSAWIDASPELGTEIGRRLNALSGGARIESYGKAIMVGIDGEYEHGNALLTNPAANPVRDAVGGGASWVPPRASAAFRALFSTFLRPQGCSLRSFALRHDERFLR